MSHGRISERRASARSRQLKTASIVLNGDNSVLSCTVRNISEAGLCLMVPSPWFVPTSFEVLTESERRHCMVVWRLSDRIGAKYQ